MSPSLPAAPRPTVLFLIHDLRRGGAERVFAGYVLRIRHVRAVPVLVRRIIELSDDLDPARVLDLDGTKAELASSTGRPGGPVGLLLRAWRLRTLAKQQNAQVVSTFLHKSHVIALFTKLLLYRNLKVVVNVHEMQSQHLRHHFEGSFRIVMRLVLRRLLPRADLFVAVAQGVADDLTANFAVPADRIVVIPNGVDAPRIRARAREPLGHHELPVTAPIIVTAGRLVRLKGHADLLLAFSLLPRAERGTLILMGEGPERPGLERLAARLGLAGCVLFTGFRENPWNLLARADLFVLPSHTEAFPNVLGEALALEVPVVATRCSPGVEEYLEHGRCGVLVPPGDPAALAQGIRSTLSDRALRSRLVEHGRARVEGLDAERVAGTYEKALRRVLDTDVPSGRGPRSV